MGMKGNGWLSGLWRELSEDNDTYTFHDNKLEKELKDAGVLDARCIYARCGQGLKTL